MKRMRAFTLIELLVVISIIALLIAILMPSFVEDAFAGDTQFCFNPGGWSYSPWSTGPSWSVGKWWDPLAGFHNNAATFSFFDGHAEMHQWVHKDTWEFFMDPAPGIMNRPYDPPVEGNEDMKWMWLGWPVNHPYEYY